MSGALGQGEWGGARVREPTQTPRRSPQAALHITLQAWLQAREALGDAAHLAPWSPSTHCLPPLLLFLPHSPLYLSSLNSLVHFCPRTFVPAIPATYNALPSDLHTMGPSCHWVTCHLIHGVFTGLSTLEKTPFLSSTCPCGALSARFSYLVVFLPVQFLPCSESHDCDS